jgi:ribosome-binding protein aMBF1 (putative translation factor)
MVKFKGKNYTTIDDIHNVRIKDPAYKKAYDELDLEFSIISAVINARIKKGITQKKLAEKMGTKQSSIARFESGNYNPTLEFIQKLLNAIGAKIKVSSV